MRLCNGLHLYTEGDAIQVHGNSNAEMQAPTLSIGTNGNGVIGLGSPGASAVTVNGNTLLSTFQSSWEVRCADIKIGATSDSNEISIGHSSANAEIGE